MCSLSRGPRGGGGLRRLLLKAGSLRRLGGSSGRLAGVPEAREDYFALKSCYYLALFGQLVRGRRIREDGGGKSSLYSVYFSDYRGVVATENAQKPLENEGFSEYGGGRCNRKCSKTNGKT